jgi:hypothetical protein
MEQLLSQFEIEDGDQTRPDASNKEELLSLEFHCTPFDIYQHTAEYREQEQERIESLRSKMELQEELHCNSKPSYVVETSLPIQKTNKPPPTPATDPTVFFQFVFAKHKWDVYRWPRDHSCVWMALSHGTPHFKLFQGILQGGTTKASGRGRSKVKRLRNRNRMLEIPHPRVDTRPCGRLLSQFEFASLWKEENNLTNPLQYLQPQDYICFFEFLRQHSNLKKPFHS